MKTTTQSKFDQVIKEGFHEILKPLGFKKKANNFYLQLDTLGQIINVQKSAWGHKDKISFTINVGIFVPEYWLTCDNDDNKELPAYPAETQCLIRKRIGDLRADQLDTWYEIIESTGEQQLIAEMRNNLTGLILPYFNRLNSTEKLLQELDSSDVMMPPLVKLILFGEFKQFDKAKHEYEQLLSNTKSTSLLLLKDIKEYGQKYGLDK
jgi:hypothetical protein